MPTVLLPLGCRRYAPGCVHRHRSKQAQALGRGCVCLPQVLLVAPDPKPAFVAPRVAMNGAPTAVQVNGTFMLGAGRGAAKVTCVRTPSSDDVDDEDAKDRTTTAEVDAVCVVPRVEGQGSTPEAASSGTMKWGKLRSAMQATSKVAPGIEFVPANQHITMLTSYVAARRRKCTKATPERPSHAKRVTAIGLQVPDNLGLVPGSALQPRPAEVTLLAQRIARYCSGIAQTAVLQCVLPASIMGRRESPRGTVTMAVHCGTTTEFKDVPMNLQLVQPPLVEAQPSPQIVNMAKPPRVARLTVTSLKGLPLTSVYVRCKRKIAPAAAAAPQPPPSPLMSPRSRQRGRSKERTSRWRAAARRTKWVPGVRSASSRSRSGSRDRSQGPRSPARVSPGTESLVVKAVVDKKVGTVSFLAPPLVGAPDGGDSTSAPVAGDKAGTPGLYSVGLAFLPSGPFFYDCVDLRGRPIEVSVAAPAGVAIIRSSFANNLCAKPPGSCCTSALLS